MNHHHKKKKLENEINLVKDRINDIYMDKINKLITEDIFLTAYNKLINDNEKGITMFYLKAGALSGLITLASPSKMTLDKADGLIDNVSDVANVLKKLF